MPIPGRKYIVEHDHSKLKSTTKIAGADGTNIATVTDEGYQDIVTHSDHSGDSISFAKDGIAATVEGTYGNPTPAVGDIVLKVTRTAGQGNLAVVIGYHSHND